MYVCMYVCVCVCVCVCASSRYAALMEEQRAQALYMQEQGYIVKEQIEKREKYKKETAAAIQAKFDDTWDNMQRQAVEAADKETREVGNSVRNISSMKLSELTNLGIMSY